MGGAGSQHIGRVSHAPWFAQFRPVCLHFLPKTCFRAHLVNDQIDQMRVWQLWGCVHAREPFIWYPTMSQHPRGTLDTITCHIGASTHAHSTPFARRATQIDQIQRRMAAVRLLHAREPLICYPAMGKHPRGPWAPLHATCWREPCALYLVHAPRDANRPNAYQMQ